MDGESSILFPVRSNARSLITGSGIASVRRRLRVASILYDRVALEEGIVDVHAGPTGSMSFWSPAPPGGGPPRWDTPRDRAARQKSDFSLSVGVEETPGVQAPTMRPVIESETTVSWNATLEPFFDEIAKSCDWFVSGRTDDPQGEAATALRRRNERDERNEALERVIPERFARNLLIANANRDLLLGAANRMPISQDALHSQVVSARLADPDSTLRLVGFALPLLVPDVAELPWETIADLRKDRGLQRFRRELHDVETAVHEVVMSGGDAEAAVNTELRQRVTALGEGPKLASTLAMTALGSFVGAGASLATAGISGPIATVAGGGLGAATELALLTGPQLYRQRRSRRWVATLTRIETASATT